MAIGPVQLLVLGFDKPDFHGVISKDIPPAPHDVRKGVPRG